MVAVIASLVPSLHCQPFFCLPFVFPNMQAVETGNEASSDSILVKTSYHLYMYRSLAEFARSGHVSYE